MTDRESADTSRISSPFTLRAASRTSTGYDDEVLSYLDSLGVTSDNLKFYVATHPHSDHIGTGDTIVRLYSPDRVYLLPYDDSYIYNTARLWTIFMSTTSFLLL